MISTSFLHSIFPIQTEKYSPYLITWIQPPELDVTHLDAGQCLIEFLGNRTHLLHTCREADFLAVVNDLANRGDNSCGTAQTALCESLPRLSIFHALRSPCRGNLLQPAG